MVISPLPPGANAQNDATWIQTYGASMDCVMSIMDGEQMAENIIDTGFKWSSPSYFGGLPHANNSSLYVPIDGKQQVHFIVGKSTVASFRNTATDPILANESRSLGIRAPMQMCGWGKTITMRPTDPEPRNKRINDDEHKLDRSTWKVGPFDARWDDNRKMWRSFNDLIVDDEGQNLGTFVFSTNPDAACGFPFLRAKLEDVLSVRRTLREIGTEGAAKADDITKSAMLCVKLDSYALKNNKIGSWSDVLVVADLCKQTPLEGVCGTETTKEGKLSISTTADFFASAIQSGPVVFSVTPPSDKIITGEMYYQGDGCGGSWKPGIEVDICDKKTGGPAALGELYTNDKALQSAIILLCEQLGEGSSTSKDPTGSFIERINQNRDWLKQDINIDIDDAQASIFFAEEVKGALSAIETWTFEIVGTITNEMQQSIGSAIVGASQALDNAITALQAQVFSAMQQGFDFIVLQLAEKCDCAITSPELDKTPIPILPALGQPPNVEPGLDLSSYRISINNIQDQDYQGNVIDKLTILDGEIVDAEGEDETSQEDGPQVQISITVSDPCSGASVKEECVK
jgi:hypothetical protein